MCLGRNEYLGRVNLTVVSSVQYNTDGFVCDMFILHYFGTDKLKAFYHCICIPISNPPQFAPVQFGFPFLVLPNTHAMHIQSHKACMNVLHNSAS